MQTLKTAESGYCHRIIDVQDKDLASKLMGYGVYKNSLVIKVDSDETDFPTVKLYTKNGTVAVHGQLAKNINVRSGKGIERNLYEMEEEKSANISHIDGCEKTHGRLKALGIEIGMRVKVLRFLPYMQYSVLVDSKRRVKLSEGVVASIIGKQGENQRQLFFAKRNEPIEIQDVVAGEKIARFLSDNGIKKGESITLEIIEPGKNILFDAEGDITIYIMEGFRMTISDKTAGKVIVD